MIKILKNWRDAFIEDCRQWYKLWSSWLAILWGMIVTVLWNDPGLLREFTDNLPEETRAYLSPLVLGLVAGLPILVRLMKQNIKKDPPK